MIRRIAGGVTLTVGLLLAAWTAYNVLVEVQPEARGGSVRGTVLLAALFIWVGANWLRGRTPKRL